MSGTRYNMQSRYSKSNSSAGFGSSVPSTINLYTNRSPQSKNNTTSSGYVSDHGKQASHSYSSDHYSSPSTLTSLPGYISDIGSSHLSKASYPTNTYGSSPGVKTYSYPFSSPSVSRNLSTTTSRIPSVTSSYSSAYMRSNSKEDTKLLPPKSPSNSRYITYSRSSRNTNYGSNSLSNNSVNNSKTNKTSTESKVPADFTSDSEEENTDIESKMISHNNIVVISRSTSPNREITRINTNAESISSTQQIIRPKKIVFGVSTKKTTQQTQVNELEIRESTIRVTISPSLSPCPSPYLTPCLTPSLTPSPSHSPSPVRMRYGCTPNHRNNNSSNYNRYSMPTIRSPTYGTNYSNYCSNSNSNASQLSPVENMISKQPLSSNNIQKDIRETLVNSMSTDNDKKLIDKNAQKLNQSNNYTKNDEYDSCNNDNNNNNILRSDSKSSIQSKKDSHSSARTSPYIIRRRRSLSRNKLSGRSRSSSKEKLLDREESSTSSTSSSDEDEERKKNIVDRHSRIRRKKKNIVNEINSDNNQVRYKGSFDGINELKPTQSDSMPTRSASAEPLNDVIENNQINQTKVSTNESSSSPEKIIIKKPSANSPKLEPLIVVTKLPIKIKDPYSTASECDENDFISESDAEKVSSIKTAATIRLSASPTDNHYKQSIDISCDTSDESTKSCDSLKIEKCPTVIEVNNDNNLIKKNFDSNY